MITAIASAALALSALGFDALTLALVAGAGGVGAVLRYALDAVLKRRATTAPLGIFAVNIVACAALGVLTGLGLAAGDAALSGGFAATLPPSTVPALTSGLLGGFSTFSTIAVDSARLARRRQWGWFVVNTVGMFCAALLAFLATTLVTDVIVAAAGA